MLPGARHLDAGAQGNDLGDRLVAIDDEHALAAVSHLVQVPGEVVLQLGDIGPLHVAIIAMEASKPLVGDARPGVS
jgi:hypothetical protein